MHLPAWVRYLIALAVVAVVVALVLARPGAAPGEPVGWYTTLVLVGAVVLLCWCVGWVVVRVVRTARRRPPDG